MPDLLPILVKMAVTAAFVVGAARITERLGPALGALVATLPVSAGPGFVFLAFDHDAAFLAEALRASLATNATNMALCALYCGLAQRHGTAASLLPPLVLCTGLSLVLQRLDLGLAPMLALTALVYLGAALASYRFRDAQMPPLPSRWYDLPLRAGLVAGLVGLLVSTSGLLGPGLSGLLAPFPIVLSSLILILHPRAGGKVSAAVIAHTVDGLMGFGVALAAASVTTAAHGRLIGLLTGLAVAALWNFGVMMLKRRRA